jgi:uncharacterized protein (DUF302 family)
MSGDGLKTILSSGRPKETMDRLETDVSSKGLTVFARVNHAAGLLRMRSIPKILAVLHPEKENVI